MIAQTVAAHYPGRVRTLTSIMSNTGAQRIGRPALSTWRRMATARPPRNRAEAIEGALRIFRHIGSHGYPFDEDRVRERAGVAWDRDPTSDGVVLWTRLAVDPLADDPEELRKVGVEIATDIGQQLLDQIAPPLTPEVMVSVDDCELRFENVLDRGAGEPISARKCDLQ